MSKSISDKVVRNTVQRWRPRPSCPLPIRPNEKFGDVNAFNGGFGLFFYDELESD